MARRELPLATASSDQRETGKVLDGNDREEIKTQLLELLMRGGT